MTHLKQILKLRNPELLNKDFKKIFSKTIKKEHYINIQQYIALNKKKNIIEKENKN